MDADYKRQAIAQWRDEWILEAVALVTRNIKGISAGLEEDLREATARDSLFPSAVANARIDRFTRQTLAPAVEQFLESASTMLGNIDPALGKYAEGLKALDLSSNMAVPELEADLDHADGPAEVLVDAEDERRNWLRTLPKKIARGAAVIAETAGTASDVLISDKMGLNERIRSTAIRRVEKEWRSETNDKSLISKLVLAIDEVSAAARMQML